MAVKRPRTVSIRLTDEEYAGLNFRAAERDQSVSDYLRGWFQTGFTLWDSTGKTLAAGKDPIPSWVAARMAAEAQDAQGPTRD